ncbi:sensor histidine kinase [Bailinhaonella thermotolerans]|uniref:Sensor histidine kinase n=1 Tax=Bailinhaonella thermotolerans TaxID=1070861 RepID=A0A3A4A8W7_9ACTN|nr:histidine kinase [Bailinhaonella thermotolerans]RJL24449.1 sensor histidine kinase [Bailinhaonella thermotolerans]
MVIHVPADGAASPDRTGPRWPRWFLDLSSAWQMTLGWYLVAVVFAAPLWHQLAATLTAAAPGGGVRTALLLAYLACYIAGAPFAARRSNPWRAAFAVAICAAAVPLVFGYGLGPGNLAHAVAALSLALWWPVALMVSAALVLPAVLAGLGGWGLISLLIIVVTLAPLRHAWREYLLLEDAQEEIAEARVTEDRERLGRELHDVIGATLTTLTVKAGLARRLLESGETARAVREVGDIEELSRTALADVRAAVAAVNRLSLPAALADAEAALRAAGIRADLPRTLPDLPERVQGVFAYVVREGVTNVIKHSAATRCAVRVTASSVEIEDDGTGGGASGLGHGLRGLADRLRAAGGSVEAGPRAGSGYLLRAECPP